MCCRSRGRAPRAVPRGLSRTTQGGCRGSPFAALSLWVPGAEALTLCQEEVESQSPGSPQYPEGARGHTEPAQPGAWSWSGRSAEVSGDGPEGGQAGTMPLTAPRCARPQNAVLVDRMFEEQGPSQTVICPPFNIFKFENIPSGKSKLHSSLSCHSSSWWPWATPTRLPIPEGCM